MKKVHKNFTTGLAVSVSAFAVLAATPALAQDQSNDPGDECVVGGNTGVFDANGNCVVDGEPSGVTSDTTQTTPTNVEDPNSEGSAGGDIVVTGSRVRRDTVSSIAPLQVLSTEAQRDVGEFDAAQILQRSEAASGQQIDATFQGFVLNNGPGSQTLNLRGLGADRTLLLVNGRRLAPAGVEGAPSNPSINLLPSSLIQRYDLLLDGASSIYGSDAVAGVGNIVLRTDFDGPELFVSGNYNPGGGGNDYTIAGAYGFNFSSGFLGLGAEYAKRDKVRLSDRPFLAGCDTNYEITDSGDIRRIGVADNAIVQNRTPGVSVSESPCRVTGISGRIFQPFTRFGSVYFPANGNIANFPNDPRTGRPFNFGESTDAFGVDLDIDNDGIRDVDFQNVNTNAANTERTYISEQDLYNVMAYGEYTFEGPLNITPFFEANYSRAEISSDNAGNPQIFPSVPDLNQFNPCNFQTNPNGVDCRALDNQFQQINPGQANFGRLGRLSSGFSLPTTPIVSIQGDRNGFDVTQEQYRAVLGLRADLPFIGDSWTFETSGVYSRSEGASARAGIREDRLALALGLDPTADYDGDGIVDNTGDGIADDYDQNIDVFGAFGDPQFIGECNAAGLANPDLAAPDLNASQCVPVNLFAPSVLGGAIGDFETQAERDYVFGLRTFDTTYEQVVVNAYITGDLFTLPAGPVSVVIGGEFREDSIESNPDIVASNGLFFGFFSDQGAVGSKNLYEAFGELNAPLFVDDFWGEAEVNLSGRITEDEFYGTAGTYSLRAGWRIAEAVLLKATYGTSFRAPNLRELFLRGQSGFTGLFDPCAVPNDAFVPGDGGFQPELDTREQTTLDNCIREGRDPTTVGIDSEGLNTQQTVSGEIVSGGSLELDPETSSSLTLGVGVSETFGEWDFSFNVGYYSIEVEDSIIEPSAQFIINDCFLRDDGVVSPFCNRINIGASDRRLISGVNAGFINLNSERVKGVDLNSSLGRSFLVGGEDLRLGLNLRANHLIERSTLFLDSESGEPLFSEFQGRFGFPRWTGRATFSAGYDNFNFTWSTRWIGETEQSPIGIDPLSSAFGRGPDGELAAPLGDTCTGDGTDNVAGDGVFCRDVGFADDYFVHTASLRYDWSDFLTIRLGVSNVFDDAPPLIDCGAGAATCISNTPLGNGYDLNGREFFGALEIRF